MRCAVRIAPAGHHQRPAGAALLLPRPSPRGCAFAAPAPAAPAAAARARARGAAGPSGAASHQQQHATSTAPSDRSASSSGVRKSDVLVVGGGPAGLATALMLAKRGWTNVTVLDKLPSVEYEDPGRSYVYAIDGRGRKATDLLGLTEQLVEAGQEMSDITVVPIAGSAKTSKMVVKDYTKRLYWLPRKAFLSLLYGGVQAQQAAAAPGAAIQIITNAACTGIRKTEEGRLQVTAHVDGSELSFEPTLLVGADGLRSHVRAGLEQWEPSGRFSMQRFDSPSAGLRFKVLQLPPNPTVSKDGTLTLPNGAAGVIAGKSLRLGLLPLRDSTSSRTGNIILKPDHPFWDIKSVDKLYGYLEDCFPQLPVRQLISPSVAEGVVAGDGGSFPQPQHCNSLYLTVNLPGSSGSGSSSGSSSGSGSRQEMEAQPAASGPSGSQSVLLVGDALHCFPPDLGQGVNSALEDVAILNEVLEECGDRLDQALPRYEERRMPDVRALIRLMQFGGPYQYNQDPLMKNLWTANIIVRVALNKVLPFLFSPPAFIMIQDSQLSYSQVLVRAERTTQVLLATLGLLAVLLVLGLVRSLS